MEALQKLEKRLNYRISAIEKVNYLFTVMSLSKDAYKRLGMPYFYMIRQLLGAFDNMLFAFRTHAHLYFFASFFSTDLSDHRGTLFSQKSNSGRFINCHNKMSSGS